MEKSQKRTNGTGVSSPPEKKPYDPPKLTKYGDVAARTGGAGSGTSDNAVTSV